MTGNWLEDLVTLTARLDKGAGLSRVQEELIEKYYPLVTGKPFVRRGCSNCYHDAALEIVITYKRKGMTRQETKFFLKKGCVLVNPTSDLPVVSNSNLTDELAIAHLKARPKMIRYFEVYPDNLQELLAGEPAVPAQEPPAAPAQEPPLAPWKKAPKAKTASKAPVEEETPGVDISRYDLI
jgi:hypothetical protein